MSNSHAKFVQVFDPGETTGFVKALWDTRTAKFDLLLVSHIDWVTTAEDVHRYIVRSPPDIIVYERFALYEHKKESQVGSEFPSSQVIGMIKLAVVLARQADYTIELVKQPASILSRCSVLPQHASMLAGKAHATAAYKHLLYYITSQYALLAARSKGTCA